MLLEEVLDKAWLFGDGSQATLAAFFEGGRLLAVRSLCGLLSKCYRAYVRSLVLAVGIYDDLLGCFTVNDSR